MLRYKAFFILFLVLFFALCPGGMWVAGENSKSSTCTGHCCSSPMEDQDEDKSENFGCNPFQCHSCCFMAIPEVQTLPATNEKTLVNQQTFFFELYRFNPEFECWQPPGKLV
jgi:hypothetical protein